jgi:hypothetical protein
MPEQKKPIDPYLFGNGARCVICGLLIAPVAAALWPHHCGLTPQSGNACRALEVHQPHIEYEFFSTATGSASPSSAWAVSTSTSAMATVTASGGISGSLDGSS